jgi:hypothetical protein
MRTSDEVRTLDLGAGMPILAYVRTCYTKERPVRLTETIFAGAVVSPGTSRWRRPRWASNSTRGQVGESWRHQTDVPAQPAEPGGLPSWVMASLGLLAAVLALAGGLAVLAARRASRRARLEHAA